jgi:hypothetical protein
MREDLVVDSLVTSLLVEDEEASAVRNFLEAICRRRPQDYHVFGRPLEVVHSIPGVPKASSTFMDFGEGGCSAKLVLRCPDEPRREIHLKYVLSHHAVSGRTYLRAEFTPTTIVAGSNAFPATISSELTGDSWPSSSRKVFGAMLRLGYSLLDVMHAQRFNGQRLFSSSATRIKEGNFRVLRAQWASYIPTRDRLRFLQLLPVMYGHTILSGQGTVDLAHHLKLIYDHYPKDGTVRPTGSLLRKRRGKKWVWSVAPYDKRARLAEMKQLKTLTEEEIEIVEGSVRLDVTAQPLGIIETCRDAQRRLEQLPRNAWSWSQEFIEGSPKATAWWLERAVVVLSCQVEAEQVTRGSFSRWLLPKALGHVTKLRALAKFSRAGFRRLVDLDDPVVDAWREIELPKGRTMVRELIARSRLSRAAIYKRRKTWLERFSIDILVPYGFYRDLLFYGPNSVMRAVERGEMVRAVDRANGRASMRLQRRAARRFDEARVEILRPAMQARPRALPVFVPPGPLAYSRNEQAENGRGRRSHDRSRLFAMRERGLDLGFRVGRIRAEAD